MSAWTPLLPAAMVGTDRQKPPDAAWPGAIGTAVAQAAASDSEPATALLRVAAVLAVCGQAGAQGVAWTDALPTPAPPDIQPPLADDALVAAVRWAFAEGPARLHHQALAAIGAAGLRLPPGLLPAALDLGRRSVALRTLLAPTLGARGRWLATQREDWRYAAGGPVETTGDAPWHEGSVEQRRAFLAEERRRDPAAARARLAAALPELPVRERADLSLALATGLSIEDEPLLEILRADRSRDVRQAALRLLLRLPDAAHPQRAAARLAPLVTREGGMLRRRWRVDAPGEFADGWKADQVEPARPARESLGERAWWLYQLVRQVPLAWWPAHTQLSPAALMEWSAGTEWAEALVRGWRDVLLAAPDAEWAEALLDHWPAALLRDDPATVLALLPAPRRERFWHAQLRGGEVPLAMLTAQILAACPPGEALSEVLSRALVDRLEALGAADALAADPRLSGLLPDLAAAIHSSVLDRLADLPRHLGERPSFTETLAAVVDVAATRRALATLVRFTRTP